MSDNPLTAQWAQGGVRHNGHASFSNAYIAMACKECFLFGALLAHEVAC